MTKIMKMSEIAGKTICLLLMSKDDKGDDDWAAIKGEILFRNERPYFRNPNTSKPFALPDNTLQRIRKTPDDIRTIVLNCDYFLPLSVGLIPEAENMTGLVDTGLKWPIEKKETKNGEQGHGA